MFSTTKQERLVMITVAFLIIAGSILQYLFKQYPHVASLINFVDSRRAYPKINVNTASLEELVEIPYIGNYTAQKIVQYRLSEGDFESLSQVRDLPGIRRKNFEIFSKYLMVSSE